MMKVIGRDLWIGGVLQAAERFGWKIIPTVDMRASPSGRVEDGVVETWWREFSGCAAEPLQRGVEGISYNPSGSQS